MHWKLQLNSTYQFGEESDRYILWWTWKAFKITTYHWREWRCYGNDGLRSILLFKIENLKFGICINWVGAGALGIAVQTRRKNGLKMSSENDEMKGTGTVWQPKGQRSVLDGGGAYTRALQWHKRLSSVPNKTSSYIGVVTMEPNTKFWVPL